ncbi:MAG: primosomal protein [Sciscionella sp.]
MAQDIVPIELGLTRGDVVTLWAPRWREEGEEWEAFLGDGDALFVFSDAAAMAAFVRTAEEHDLSDHPAWQVVPGLAASELIPDENHQYDLVGVPELVAEDPDSWTINELADIVAMVDSIADVCELESVQEVLTSCTGFKQLPNGTLPFTGRDGIRLWTDLAETVAARWDEVLDAIEGVTSTPAVPADALATAQEELAAYEAELQSAAEGADADDADDIDEVDSEDSEDAEDEALDEPAGFWADVGIDPIEIILGGREYYTLRCYLDDKPIFLGSGKEIDVFGSARALGRFLTTADAEDLAISKVSTWAEVAVAATNGDLEVKVDEDNTYVLDGIAADIEDGPDAVDPVQLDLAMELLTDGAQWAGDDSVATALAQSESLGWLVSFVLRPDPTRLAPSAPFTAEVAAWRELVTDFEERLRTH